VRILRPSGKDGVALSTRRRREETLARPSMLVMTPFPIFPSLLLAASLEVPMLMVVIVFPLLVINRLTSPWMAIVIIRVVISGVHDAADYHRRSKCSQTRHDDRLLSPKMHIVPQIPGMLFPISA
jgi:hypothetical protein